MTADYPDKSDSLQGGASQVVDIVVIGAGFSGMYALHRLRNDYRLICFEAGESVGGTWYWNRYPGARVDIESMEYSYDFDEALQQEWKWPEMFSAQPELEAYANHVADRFGLRDQIRFSTRVERLEFNESRSLWHVFTDRNDHVICKYVIAATGSLAVPTIPNWPGKDSFQGKLYHTAQWPREGVDVAGKRVGIIGTGSTGIQAAPMLAQTAGHLFVFQRTPAFSMPSGNRPLSEEYERQWKANYAERRERMWHTPSLSLIQPSDKSIFEYSPEEQQEILEKAWSSQSAFQLLVAFKDIMTDRKANDIVAEFVRNKIRATVKDPKVAELLCPTTYAIGAKRLCIDSGYYQMYNRDNVTLVDARTNPITGFTPSGIRTTAATYDLDVIVFATGFDAMTGADPHGHQGIRGCHDAREVARGPHHLSGHDGLGLPEPVHGPWARQPIGACRHDHGRGMAGQLDRPRHRRDGEGRLRADRRDEGGGRELGRRARHGRGLHAAQDRRFLVHGSERGRQTPLVHGLRGRLSPIFRAVHEGAGRGLSRLCHAEGADHRSAGA